MHLKSLRARMTASVTIAFAIWTLIICIGLMTYERYDAAREVTRLLQTTVDTLRRDVTDNASSDETNQAVKKTPAQDFIDEHREDLIANNLALTIVDTHGHVLQRSETDAPPLAAPPSK